MQKQNTNRFMSFQDADETPAPVVKKEVAKKVDPTKKVVVKVQKTTEADMVKGEFDLVESNRPVTAGGRGGRGGERGRGGRGGERGGRGGDRGGRGGRPRPGTAKAEGDEGDMTKDKPNREFKKFEGKAREGAHPFDRKDGTGRAHRGERKGGDSKGTWGNERKADAAEVEGATEERKDAPKRDRKPREDRPPRERRERREGGDRRPPRREQEEEKEEAPVEEEEVGFTLEDYMAQQQAKATGLELQGKARAAEKFNMKNTAAGDDNHGAQFSQTIDTKLTSGEAYAVTPGTGAAMFGFTAAPDMTEDRRGRKDLPAQKPKGGRKGKLVIDDNEFPAL